MDHNETPSTPGPNGRGGNGRFTAGNQFGGGNPLAGRAAKIRAVLLEKLTPEAAGEIADVLIAQARAGDMASIRELLDRCIGKPIAGDIEQRLSDIEQQLAERKESDAHAK